MRVKAKTWGVIGPINSDLTCLDLHSQKSQLQTVLITASGPQALNALVHRRRYTQGSRQNRCVSSQEALALRAKVSGKRVSQCPFAGGRLTAVVQALAVCALCLRPFGVCEGYLSDVYGLTICIPLARRRLRMAEDCQLRTAYGGESNCIIKTKVCDASKWCISQTDFCQCSECQCDEIHRRAGKRRE